MSDNSSGSGFAFIAGLAVGAIVGGMAGLLFAPEAGDETRKKLQEKSKELTEDLHDKFDDFKDTVNDALENVKTKVEDVKDKVTKEV